MLDVLLFIASVCGFLLLYMAVCALMLGTWYRVRWAFGWRPHIFNARLIRVLSRQYAEDLVRDLHGEAWLTMAPEDRDARLTAVRAQFAAALEEYVHDYADPLTSFAQPAKKKTAD